MMQGNLAEFRETPQQKMKRATSEYVAAPQQKMMQGKRNLSATIREHSGTAP